jgi:hypothetical protein
LPLFILVVLAFAVHHSMAQTRPVDQRGVKPLAQVDPAAVQNGAYYALVIGINRYRPPLASLKTPVNDAQAVAKLLSERYGFQVKVLVDEDAVRDNILDTLVEYRQILNENDNLLIYFAGHGQSDAAADKTYWLPADADKNTNSHWITADDLTSDIRALPARHVLVISDSCYSGGLTRDAGIDLNESNQQRFLGKMLAGKSRTLMASGRDEPVADGGANGHSVFANAVLGSLMEMDDAEFTAGDLFHRYVQRRVAGSADQIPQYENIRKSNDQGGDFVFVRSAAAAMGKVEIGRAAVRASASQPGSGINSSLVAAPAQAPPYNPPPTIAGRSDPRTYGAQTAPEGAAGAFDPVATQEKAEAYFRRGAYYAALPLYKQLADSGNAEAMAAIGTMYELGGSGVPKDIRVAAQWHLKAAEGGDSAAMQSIGLDYLVGEGVPQDDAQAARWLQPAAEAGQVMAMGAFGFLYEKGRGVPKNLNQALVWYRKAAAQGDETAKGNLKRLGYP